MEKLQTYHGLVIFPLVGEEGRHPSQIYEAFLEGISFIFNNKLYFF